MRNVIGIVFLVLLVVVVGFFVSSDFTFLKSSSSLTGNVVKGSSIQGQNIDCSSCPSDGVDVCAGKYDRLRDYENRCEALCDNAKVVSEGRCALLNRR